MTEDEVIALAVAHNLGRTMKPLGMQTGDVFVTDQSYRTGELLAFTGAVQAAARDRYSTALRIAREGYASEAATGLPVLPQWRERAIALIDEALGDL